MPRHRILIVDDDIDVRESLEDELRSAYDVVAAKNGNDAIQSLGESAYDAVISDLRMPDVSGLEVLEYARKVHPEIVRILLTGFLDDEARRATRSSSETDFGPIRIAKPWHDELDSTMRHALEQRDIRRSLQASVAEAVVHGSIDDELAAQEGLVGIARVLVAHSRAVSGVTSLLVSVAMDGQRHVLAEFCDPVAHADWHLSEYFSADGPARAWRARAPRLLANDRGRHDHASAPLGDERSAGKDHALRRRR